MNFCRNKDVLLSMKKIIIPILLGLLFSCGSGQQQTDQPRVNVDIQKEIPQDILDNMWPEWFDASLLPSHEDKVTLSNSEWRERLSVTEYRILRNEGTEAPFVNEYHRTDTEGIYVCRACHNPVFSSVTKFHSSSGWPSYFAPIDLDFIGVKVDRSLWMERTEVHCARCKSHLGHVFDDGPQPTGLRYCLNSLALQLVDEDYFEKIKNGEVEIL